MRVNIKAGPASPRPHIKKDDLEPAQYPRFGAVDLSVLPMINRSPGSVVQIQGGLCLVPPSRGLRNSGGRVLSPEGLPGHEHN